MRYLIVRIQDGTDDGISVIDGTEGGIHDGTDNGIDVNDGSGSFVGFIVKKCILGCRSIGKLWM